MRGRLHRDDLRGVVKAALRQMIADEIRKLPETEEESREALTEWSSAMNLWRTTDNLRMLLNVWISRGYTRDMDEEEWAKENPDSGGENEAVG